MTRARRTGTGECADSPVFFALYIGRVSVIAFKTFYVPKRFVASKLIGIKPSWLASSFETLGIPHSLFVQRGKIESTSEV